MGRFMSETVKRVEVFCTVCNTVSPREITFRRYDDGGTYHNEYCKACKSFSVVETDASGAVTRSQSDF